MFSPSFTLRLVLCFVAFWQFAKGMPHVSQFPLVSPECEPRRHETARWYSTCTSTRGLGRLPTFKRLAYSLSLRHSTQAVVAGSHCMIADQLDRTCVFICNHNKETILADADTVRRSVTVGIESCRDDRSTDLEATIYTPYGYVIVLSDCQWHQ
ncbi:hypothetical protein BDV35DRAFT_104262 [Aspergillus flavus]|uniref:Uncharacterized protein n=1 Tax=Aspergillus flavus TaxID=5059 RepID=A0A5N6GEE5_ASPFL|nr:hypothetical protein BDV35DRAFT_104262 [Aspergillus flavus]